MRAEVAIRPVTSRNHSGDKRECALKYSERQILYITSCNPSNRPDGQDQPELIDAINGSLQHFTQVWTGPETPLKEPMQLSWREYPLPQSEVSRRFQRDLPDLISIIAGP